MNSKLIAFNEEKTERITGTVGRDYIGLIVDPGIGNGWEINCFMF
jgi:hypothetical protein